MTLLRDPLLLTLLASSLAHGLVFSLDPATTARPAAAVQPGRTAVLLRPSLAAPLTTLADPSPDSITPINPLQTPRVVPQPFQSPPRQESVETPPHRPVLPQLASSSISPTPRPSTSGTPGPATQAAPDPPPPADRDAPTPPDRSTSNSRIPSPPAPGTIRSRQPGAIPIATRPRPSLRPAPPLQVALTSRPRSASPPRPTHAAPVHTQPSLAQPSSQDDPGAKRSLPVAAANNPTPDYPAAAASRGQQGTTLVLMNIDATGRVARASVHRSSGHDNLDHAALTAARRWVFQPARRGSQAIAITVVKPFRFVLQRR